MVTYPLVMLYPVDAPIAVPLGQYERVNGELKVTFLDQVHHAWSVAMSLAISGAPVPKEILRIMHQDWIETPSGVVEGMEF